MCVHARKLRSGPLGPITPQVPGTSSTEHNARDSLTSGFDGIHVASLAFSWLCCQWPVYGEGLCYRVGSLASCFDPPRVPTTADSRAQPINVGSGCGSGIGWGLAPVMLACLGSNPMVPVDCIAA